jgi:hypothetical protein
MSHTPHKHKNLRKAKKSYTLSPESVRFLETMRKRRQAPSVSSVLEEIIQEARHELRKAALDQKISAYYDSLTKEEMDEQAAWGEFSMREFAMSEFGRKGE